MNIFKRAYMSFQARVVQPYMKNHFEKTKYGKKIANLKNTHKGERCFIIGNGPSLVATDLDKLKHEYTFAFNRVYYIFNKTEWRPTFYCFQDEKIAKSSEKEIEKKIDTKYVFFPISLKWYENIKIKSDYAYVPLFNSDDTTMPVFCESLEKGISVGNTVAFTAIQLAVYMGFKEIYLIGIDHSFSTYQTKDGKVISDPNIKDYFCEEYNKDKQDLYIPRLDLSLLSYISAKEYCDKHNIKIFNATRGGKLEVFDRINFDDLF